MKYCVKYHGGRRHPWRGVEAGTYTQQPGGVVVHSSVGKSSKARLRKVGGIGEVGAARCQCRVIRVAGAE